MHCLHAQGFLWSQLSSMHMCVSLQYFQVFSQTSWVIRHVNNNEISIKLLFAIGYKLGNQVSSNDDSQWVAGSHKKSKYLVVPRFTNTVCILTIFIHIVAKHVYCQYLTYEPDLFWVHMWIWTRKWNEKRTTWTKWKWGSWEVVSFE